MDTLWVYFQRFSLFIQFLSCTVSASLGLCRRERRAGATFGVIGVLTDSIRHLFSQVYGSSAHPCPVGSRLSEGGVSAWQVIEKFNDRKTIKRLLFLNCFQFRCWGGCSHLVGKCLRTTSSAGLCQTVSSFLSPSYSLNLLCPYRVIQFSVLMRHRTPVSTFVGFLQDWNIQHWIVSCIIVKTRSPSTCVTCAVQLIQQIQRKGSHAGLALHC